MLTYDYTIKRIVGKDKVREFVPNLLPKTLDNIVSIEGPNSSGKSTLLNIIALGLYGNKNQKVNPVLQAKLSSLIDSDHQKIKFNFEISSANSPLSLRVTKENFDRSDFLVEENEGKCYKPLSPQTFERKYNLIYDIPNNPTERLSELLRELREEQAQYGNKFSSFSTFLRKTISQISTSRDTDRLGFVKKQLDERKDERQKILDYIPNEKSLVDALEKSAYLRFYYYYCNENQRLTEDHKRISEEIKKFGEDSRKISNKLKLLKSKYGTTANLFRERYNEVTPLIEGSIPKSEKSRLKIWRGISPYQLDVDDLSTLKIEAVYYTDLLGNELTKIQNKGTYKDASVLKRVLDSIEQYEHSGLLLTKLSVTLGDIIKVLREEYENSSIVVKQYQTISLLVETLSAMVKDIDQLVTMKEEIAQESQISNKFAENATETYYGERAELTQVESDLQKALGRVNIYHEKCCSVGFDEQALLKPYSVNATTVISNPEADQYLSLSETEILSKIAEKKLAITKKNSELNALNIFIGNYEKELEKLEKQEPHKYEKNKCQLLELLQKTEAISQKILDDDNQNLKNLINKSVTLEDVEKDLWKQRYYDEVSKYLAFRVGNFRHIDKIYRAKVVDLIAGKILTDDETIIYIADMGTGQSQSAYLLSLLNTKNDDRKIIALFDEIAMMDETSLQPIYDKLKELEKDDKLLLGILVEKSNQISVKPIK